MRCLVYGVNRQDIKCFCLGLKICREKNCLKQKEYQKVRGEIVKLMGDLPRIELFARQKTEGWDVWGNEVESDIEL